MTPSSGGDFVIGHGLSVWVRRDGGAGTKKLAGSLLWLQLGSRREIAAGSERSADEVSRAIARIRSLRRKEIASAALPDRVGLAATVAVFVQGLRIREVRIEGWILRSQRGEVKYVIRTSCEFVGTGESAVRGRVVSRLKEIHSGLGVPSF